MCVCVADIEDYQHFTEEQLEDADHVVPQLISRPLAPQPQVI